MKTLITELQKLEIVTLARDHRGALIAFGADNYAQGVKKGTKKGLTLAFGVWATCFVIGYGIGMIKFVAEKKKV